jgi:hypothetical protein
LRFFSKEVIFVAQNKLLRFKNSLSTKKEAPTEVEAEINTLPKKGINLNPKNKQNI